MAGKPGRSGPKPGNMNALKTAQHVDLKRFRGVVGEYPIISVKREGIKSRKLYEAETIRVKGVISLTDAHHIDTAVAATVQAAVARWLLRNRMKEQHTPDGPSVIIHKGQGGDSVRQQVGMSTADILRCMETIAKAKQVRDKAIAALNLDAPPKDPWEIFDGTIAMTAGPDPPVSTDQGPLLETD